MDISIYIQSVLEQDPAAIVICDLQHKILYMNPAAIHRYARRGGAALIGKNLFNCHNARSQEKINAVIRWFAASQDNNMIFTTHNAQENKDVYMVALRDTAGTLIGYYEKHVYRNSETIQPYHTEQGEIL